MLRSLHRALLLAGALLLLCGRVHAVRFFYASQYEQTEFNEYIMVCLPGDTVRGPMRSNSHLAYTYCVFEDTVYFIEPRPANWDPADPHFLVPPVFDAPLIIIPRNVDNLRNPAIAQGNVFADPHRSYRLYLDGDSLIICQWGRGTLFDSSECTRRPVINDEVLYFDAPLEIEGHLSGRLYVASSHNILLLDDVIYDDADPQNGVTPATSQNLLVLASEKQIKVANTCANGRNNSNSLGLNQTDRDSTSIVITAALYALGQSFTFEQQNDVDSGYVYLEGDPPVPHSDDRGTIYLYGSLTQWRRGYVHRANNGSTGYRKRYEYDQRFRTMADPYPFISERTPGFTTDTLDFAAVPIGQTVWDTAHVYYPEEDWVTLGSVLTLPPFSALRVPPFQGDRFAIPVSFTPTHSGQYNGVLQVYSSSSTVRIVLRGRGLPGGLTPPHFDISPNPFNAVTTLRYSLERPGAVGIVLYDVLGRAAREVRLESVPAGEHAVQIDGTGLASGVYFARLQTSGQTLTRKLLLLK